MPNSAHFLGQSRGRYGIIEQIGEGGMGVVDRARDELHMLAGAHLSTANYGRTFSH